MVELCKLLVLSACALSVLSPLASAEVEAEVCTAADDGTSTCNPSDTRAKGRSLGIAFVGNSLTYYNDLPHLVQSFLSADFAGSSVRVGACLRGGAGLPELWEQGGRAGEEVYIGGRDTFETVEALLSAKPGWDVVILQDKSQGPARESSRQRSLDFLDKFYAPLLRLAGQPPPVVLLYETWGYLHATMQSEEIGDFLEMTQKVEQGYRSYAEVLIGAGLDVYPVPAGKGFVAVHDRAPDLWRSMYQTDAFHPTALGSFLVGAHMATTIANFPLFAPLYPTGVSIPSAWPAEVVTFEGQAAPSAEELSAVLQLAGPGALSARSKALQQDAGLPAGPEQSGQEPPVSAKATVRCATTTGPITVEVYPDWAPNGARRFLDMVESGFFSTKVALFRSVRGFICQTGVAGDPEVNRQWQAKGNLADDPQWLDSRDPQRMKRGYLSFAGSGPNSRNNEFFFTYRDIGLGTSPWEVPFGKLIGEESYQSMDHWHTGYGDVPAFGGHSPDQGRMYQEGVAYVEAGFPDMDYVTSCSVE